MIEDQKKQLQAMLDKVTDHVKATAEAADKEVKNLGELTEKTKAAADEALSKQGEIQARLNVIEQLLAKGQDLGGEVVARTAGQLVAEHDSIGHIITGVAGRATVQLGALGLMNAADPDAGTSVISGGNLVAPDRSSAIAAMGRCKLSVRDLLAKGRTSSNAIEFPRELSYTNSAATVLENPTNQKPRSKGTLELVLEAVATIAHHERVSKQVLADAPAFASFIDMRLRHGLLQKEEQQLLKGSGSGGQLNGLYTQATAFAAPSGSASTDTTLVDTLRLAILQAELECYFADGIILNPVALANLELLKDANKAYLLTNPAMGGVPTLWGRTLTDSKALDANEWLVGAFQTEAQLFDRENATVTVYEQDQDNAVRNLVTVLAEQREVLAVYQPAAFIKNAP